MESRKSLRTYYGFLLIKNSGGTVCGRFPVTKKECTLGRDTKCDVRIILEKVSGQQCAILCVDDKAYVRDKSIAGSTKVNGKKVGRSNFLLHNSDEIDICGRKFVWEYPKKPQGELNNLSTNKSGTKNDHLSPRVTERFSNHVITPMDINKVSSTPSKSHTKTPSKTIISLNKTPIVVTTENISKYSFDELQNSLQNPNSSTTAQLGSKLIKSNSMAHVRNIPLLGDSKTTLRKSWIVTNTSDSSSSIGAHNRLSTERLKRDSTPELNSSYHYEDEDVEFDSPDPPGLGLNSENVIGMINTDNKSELIKNQGDNNLQSNKDEINKLSVIEPEPSTSRRDTYSVDDRPIVFEENSTPAPRRSILKCSKTTKSNRSRSNCRMVQFARLPKTDSKIKNTKARFNFIVTDEESNVVDLNQSTTNSMQFNVEVYDDDLDGVQPLDSSVSSLLNSPILDNSFNKSSKRGSRGNKVMSLINSIEKRTNESSKHSIRASDLLSMSGSKPLETSPNNDSQSNTNELQESVSSTRRINLEDIFEAEDTSRTTSYNLASETIVQEFEESPVKSVNKMSSSKINALNNTGIEKTPANLTINNVSENDIEIDSVCTFTSPLNLPPMNSNSSTVINSDLTYTEKDSSSTEVINTQFNTNSKLDLSSNITEDSSTDQLLTKSDKVVISPLENELTNTSVHHDNIDEIENEYSSYLEKAVDEEKCTDENKRNITQLAEISEPTEKEYSQKQIEDSEFQNNEKCTSEIQILNNTAEFTKPIEEEHGPKENDVIELVSKSTELNENEIEKQNDSKISDQTLNSKTPSIVVECMSEMFSASIDEHETTHSQHKESLMETYILVGNDNDQQNPIGVDKCNETFRENSVSSAKDINESLMDAIEVQLDKIHCLNTTSSDSHDNKTNSEDSMFNLNKSKSYLVPAVTETENLTLEINDNLSPNSYALTDVESTEIISNSVSKTKSPEKANLTISCLANISKLPTRIPIDETNAVQNISTSSENIIYDISNNLSSGNLSVMTISPKPIKKKVINLEDFKLALGANSPKEFSKSPRSSVQKESIPLKNSQTDSNKSNLEVLSLSSYSDENMDKTDKHLNHSFDKSIGRPQYESTPWNWSKSSKTLFNSTTSIQPNNTTKNSVSENKDKQRDESRSRSVTPFADQELWSQMMKDFNESVKQASSGINSSPRKKKYLFDNKSRFSNNSIKNSISEIKKNNSTQHPTMSSNMSNITLNESVQFRRSLRNKSSLVKKTLKKSIKSKKLKSSYIANDSKESSKNIKMLPSKNNFIDNKTQNETVNSDTRSTKKEPTPVRRSNRSNELQLSYISNDSKESSKNDKISSRKNNSLDTKTNNEIVVLADDIRSTKKESLRNKSSKVKISLTRSMRSEKLRSRYISNDSEDSSNNDEILPKKNNSIDNKTNNETVQADINCQTKRKTKITESATDSEIELAPTSDSKDNSTTLSSSNTDTFANNKTKKLTQEIKNSPKSSISLNLHATVNKNESIKIIKKHDKEQIMVSDNSLSSNEMASTSNSPNGEKNNKRELRRREHNNISSIKTRTKSVLNTNKVQITKKTKKNASPTKTYSSDTNNKLSESSILKLDKKNKTSIAVKSKSTKISKTVKTKKSVKLRKNTNSCSKLILESKPTNRNTEDSSEYESASETEDESIQKPQTDCPPKANKEKAQKKGVNIDNNLSSLSTRSRRENIKNSDVSLKTRTQSRKHDAAKVEGSAVSVSCTSNTPENPIFIIPKQILAVNQCPANSASETTKKTTSLRSNKTSQSKRILPSKPIKTNTKDSSEYESSIETKENTLTVNHPPKSSMEKSQKKGVHVDNNLSSLPTRRNLREKIKTPDVLLQPKTQSRKRAADTSPLSQPKAKGKKSNISSKVASVVCRASNSPKKISPIIRSRNKSKPAVKQVSDSSFPETTEVSKRKNTKLPEKTLAKKRELNSDHCSFDAPSASKRSRHVTFRGAESDTKKPNSSTRASSKTKKEITDTVTESIVSLKVKCNKNAEKSISPIQRKTRNAEKTISPVQRKTRNAEKTISPIQRKTRNAEKSISPILRKTRHAEKTISPVQRKTRNAEKSISPIQRKTRNAEKSISPIQRKTRKAKQVIPKEKQAAISPRVLRVRDKKK